jgi:hypothetical protein
MHYYKILSIFILIIIFIFGCEPKPGEQIVFEADLKVKIPEVMTVYEFAPVPFEQNFIADRKDQLDLPKDGKVGIDDMGLYYNYQSRMLFISPKTGSEMYIDSIKFMIAEPGKIPPLSREKVTDISKQYVEKMLKIDLKSAPFEKIRLLHNAVQGPDDTQPIETIDESIAQYSRKIGEFDVVGYGGFIRIHIDNEGTVTGFQKVWRNWKAYKDKVKVKPYAEAKQEFTKRVMARLKKEGFAKVVNVSFGYFTRGFLQEQKYLQPAYVFDTAYYDTERKSTVARRLEVIAAGYDLPEPLEIEKDYSKMDDIKK